MARCVSGVCGTFIDAAADTLAGPETLSLPPAIVGLARLCASL
ncbi:MULTISPECIES: hypothetical protein [unclassified Pseudomonas]|nr:MULTISPECIES: hypothetical protein [unclassified Pseudomonas]MEB0045978.1 hypothetical protein [Pseudomonas sp. Dout3]MEB0097238.1 hypothetical protein [Pseudomonas sp. DC1.2]WPX56824.1 hypothetical protein RHM68_14255 [Pseudomonas sp. DC1.2]